MEEHLKAEGAMPGEVEPVVACGCPSRNIEIFAPCYACRERTMGTKAAEVPSALTHWPVRWAHAFRSAPPANLISS